MINRMWNLKYSNEPLARSAGMEFVSNELGKAILK